MERGRRRNERKLCARCWLQKWKLQCESKSLEAYYLLLEPFVLPQCCKRSRDLQNSLELLLSVSFKNPNITPPISLSQNLRAAGNDYSVLMKSGSNIPKENQRLFCEVGGHKLGCFVACLAFCLLLAGIKATLVSILKVDAYFVSLYVH